MGQQTFDTTDYGEMTLAKLGAEGVKFKLNSVEETEGKFGPFVVLLGTKDGDPFEIRAGGRAATLFATEKEKLVGKEIIIVPSGDGMQRKYKVKAL